MEHSIVVHCNELRNEFISKLEYFDVLQDSVTKEIEKFQNQNFIKEGYLTFPYIDYTDAHRKVVIETLKGHSKTLGKQKIYRRKDIIETLLEENE